MHVYIEAKTQRKHNLNEIQMGSWNLAESARATLLCICRAGKDANYSKKVPKDISFILQL